MVNILIAEDDLLSSRLLQVVLSPHGNCDVVEDGETAVWYFKRAWRKGKPYDLICMDIMMPKMDGQKALNLIRQIESANDIPDHRKAKIIMITALDDPDSVLQAFFEGAATAYMVKPLDKRKLLRELQNLGLIND